MFSTILVPIDGSSLSNKPVSAAIKFAKLHHSGIILLSIAEPHLFYDGRPDVIADAVVVEEQNRIKAEEHVKEVAEKVKAENVACSEVVSQSHFIDDEIVAVSNQFSCDVIFMATRGKMSVLDTLFNESTTQNVLQKSPVPVLVFP